MKELRSISAVKNAPQNLSSSSTQKHHNAMLYRIAKFFARIFFYSYFRLNVVGREHIPKEGACIVVGNHTSFLDPMLICAIFDRPIHYITYAFFYFHPLIHWFCKRVYCIPVKKEGNDISALKQSLRLLKRDECVGIFPEGVRSESGKLGPGQPGGALIALKSGAPILPIGIIGAYEAFPRGSRFPKPRQITVIVGEPFSLETYRPHDKKSGEFQEAGTDIMMERIAELCGQENSLRSKIPQHAG